MRIIQIIDSLSSGGSERMAINLAIAFKESEIPSLLVVSRKLGSQASRVPKDVSFVGLEKSSFFDLKAFFKLIKVIRSFKPDLIHAHSTSLYWAVLVKFLFPKLKLIWHDHFGLADQLKSGDRKMVRRVISWIDGVVVVNFKLKNWLISETSYQEKRVKMIPNFPILSGVFQNIRKLDQPIILLQIANFRRQKNHFLSLKAFHWLAIQSSLKFELWLVGENELDLDYTAEIKEFIISNQLTDKVKLIGGGQDVEVFLENAHIGILSSDSEGLPVSLLEYGLAGLPVVITDVGECARVLGHGTLGKLIPPHEPVKFGKAILELVEHYDLALEMGENLRKKVKTEYGAQGFLSTYQEFLSSLS